MTDMKNGSQIWKQGLHVDFLQKTSIGCRLPAKNIQDIDFRLTTRLSEN